MHRASLALVDAEGRLVASYGDPRLETFARSSIKPWQTLAMLETGAADHFAFGERELAIITSSHSGEPMHVQLVQAILDRTRLSEPDLRCGAHPPFYKPEAERLGKNFSQLHNNCSGKHAGMLAACVHKEWDRPTYQSPGHPLQQRIRELVGFDTGVGTEALELGIDGCGVPTFHLPLKSLARAWARVADPDEPRGDRARHLRRVRAAMLGHPDLVAGTGRLDTDFMLAFPGRLIVKAGGEACYGGALLEPALGFALKIEDGHARAVGPLLMRLLEELKVAGPSEKEALAPHWNEPVKNVAGRVVGRIECDLHLRFSHRREAARALA